MLVMLCYVMLCYVMLCYVMLCYNACDVMLCYNACDVTLSVYPHQATLKNMPGYGGNRTYDLWNTSPVLRITSQASYSPEYITP